MFLILSMFLMHNVSKLNILDEPVCIMSAYTPTVFLSARNVGKGLNFLCLQVHIIGASLSKPHTSMTALRKLCVCMYVCMYVCLLAAIYHKF